jgi:hypothetical protein
MPIIRYAVALYIDIWNYYRIRKDPKRKYYIVGIPVFLYEYAAIEQYGLPVDEGLLAELEQDYTDWGKLFL